MAQVTPSIPDNERGIIIMVSSSAAFDGQPGQVAYSASKGAISSLTLPLTRDLARYGIRVVTIAPALFDSRMTAMMSDKVRASLTRVMEFPCTYSLFIYLFWFWRNRREIVGNGIGRATDGKEGLGKRG